MPALLLTIMYIMNHICELGLFEQQRTSSSIQEFDNVEFWGTDN